MTTQITPGIYKLTRDIKNPNRDRREKYDWRKGEFKEGMLFQVIEQVLELGGKTYRNLNITKANKHQEESFDENHPLHDALEPVTEASWAVLCAQHLGLKDCCEDVIDLLIERGVLTGEQIVSAFEEVWNRDC